MEQGKHKMHAQVGECFMILITTYYIFILKNIIEVCPCLQMPAWISRIVPRWRTLLTGWHRRTSLSSLCVVTIADCPPNSAVNRRRPGFSGCCLSCLERSATARRGCRISACLLQSPQDSSLKALLSVTPSLLSCPRSDCVIPDTLIVFVC